MIEITDVRADPTVTLVLNFPLALILASGGSVWKSVARIADRPDASRVHRLEQAGNAGAIVRDSMMTVTGWSTAPAGMTTPAWPFSVTMVVVAPVGRCFAAIRIGALAL